MKTTNPNVHTMEIKGTYPGHVMAVVTIKRLYKDQKEVDKCQTVNCTRCVLCGTSNVGSTDCFGWFNITKYFDKELENGPSCSV